MRHGNGIILYDEIENCIKQPVCSGLKTNKPSCLFPPSPPIIRTTMDIGRLKNSKDLLRVVIYNKLELTPSMPAPVSVAQHQLQMTL